MKTLAELDGILPNGGAMARENGRRAVPGVCECGDRIAPPAPEQDQDATLEQRYREDGSVRGTCVCFRRRLRATPLAIRARWAR